MIEYLGHKLIPDNRIINSYNYFNYFMCSCCGCLTYRHGPYGHSEYLYYYVKDWFDLNLTCDEYIIKKLLE